MESRVFKYNLCYKGKFISIMSSAIRVEMFSLNK